MHRRILRYLTGDTFLPASAIPAWLRGSASASKRSLAREVTISLIVTIVIVSAIAFPLSYIVISQRAETQRSARAGLLLADIIHTLEPPLRQEDLETIRHFGQAYFQNELVDGLRITGPRGEVYVDLDRTAAAPMSVRREAVVSDDGQIVGRVELAVASPLSQLWQVFVSSLPIIFFGFIILNVIVGLLLRTLLHNPLQALADMIRAYAIGDDDPDRRSTPFVEFQPLVRVLDDMETKIARQMADLRQAEAKYRNIFENALEGIFQSTPQGYFISVNPAAAQILGYESPEELMRSVTDIGQQLYADPERRQELIDLMKRGQMVTEFEVQNYRKDGSLIWLSLNARPVYDEQGQLHYMEGLLQDITRRKAAEEGLQKYQRQLEALVKEQTAELRIVIKQLEQELAERERAEAELRESEIRYRELARQNANLYEQTRRDAETRAILLQEINHRVKNNLAAIISLLSAQQHYARQQGAAAIDAFSQDMIYRVQGLATVHHLLSGSQWSPLLLNELVSQVIDSLLRMLPPEKRMEVEVSPSAIRVETGQANTLALVVNEVGTNAVKYALGERDTAHLCVTIQPPVDGCVQLEFRDDGPGYPDHVLDGKQQTLGLHLIRTVVEENLAGRLELDNNGGAVTRIWVELAITPEERLAASPEGQQAGAPDVLQPASVEAAPEPDWPAMRLLLVDDHPLFLAGLRDMLLARGIQVVGTALDGLAAQKQARALQPDMILMDLEMPRCDGLEATRKIMAELPDVKIVMLTASTEEAHLFEALKSGAHGYLLKGLQDEEFFNLLAEVARGEAMIDPALASRILSELALEVDDEDDERDQEPPDLASLTPRQAEVLRLVSRGLTYKEVGAALHLTERTIKYHMGRILEQLHLESRRQAVTYARRQKMHR